MKTTSTTTWTATTSTGPTTIHLESDDFESEVMKWVNDALFQSRIVSFKVAKVGREPWSQSYEDITVKILRYANF